MSREVRLYLVPHLPKNSNCTTMLMARRVETMLSREVGLYLAPPPTCLRTPKFTDEIS